MFLTAITEETEKKLLFLFRLERENWTNSRKEERVLEKAGDDLLAELDILDEHVLETVQSALTQLIHRLGLVCVGEPASNYVEYVLKLYPNLKYIYSTFLGP